MTPRENQLIAKYTEKAPVDITALCTELGLSVYETYDLRQGVSGMISRDSCEESPSEYSISVNGLEPYTRKRFTVAHECAHYLLHRNQIGKELSDNAMYRSEKLTSRDEFAANNLAADLLMPRKLVNEFVTQGQSDLSKLASIFEVSEPAM